MHSRISGKVIESGSRYHYLDEVVINVGLNMMLYAPS